MEFLNLAAGLAAKVDWRDVFPNPRVGGVIVRDGKVIATGVHEKYGGSHAEVNAILNLDTNFKPGLEIYITLEPCDHFPGKKTGSCTQKLLKLGPDKIVIGALDERFGGKNVEKLRAAGIEVEVVNHEVSQNLARVKPKVILKMAQTLDGKISPHPQQRERGASIISSLESRKKVHQWRSEVDAILTTTATVIADNPILDCRLLNKKCVPQLCLFGKRKVPSDAKIFQFSGREILRFSGKDLSHDLREISEQGVKTVLTECGATMATALLRENLVDEIWLFVAPKIFGKGISIFSSEIPLDAFLLNSVEESGGDVFMKFIKG